MAHFRIAGTKLLMYSLRVARGWNQRGQNRHMDAMCKQGLLRGGYRFEPRHDIKAKRAFIRGVTRQPLTRIINRKRGVGDYRHIPSGFPSAGMPRHNARVA